MKKSWAADMFAFLILALMPLVREVLQSSGYFSHPVAAKLHVPNARLARHGRLSLAGPTP